MSNIRMIAYQVDDDGFIINRIVSNKNTDRNIIQLEHNMENPRWDFKKEKWIETITDEELKKSITLEKKNKMTVLKSLTSKIIFERAPLYKQINVVLLNDYDDKRKVTQHIENMTAMYRKIKIKIRTCKKMKSLMSMDSEYMESFLRGK